VPATQPTAGGTAKGRGPPEGPGRFVQRQSPCGSEGALKKKKKAAPHQCLLRLSWRPLAPAFFPSPSASSPSSDLLGRPPRATPPLVGPSSPPEKFAGGYCCISSGIDADGRRPEPSNRAVRFSLVSASAGSISRRPNLAVRTTVPVAFRWRATCSRPGQLEGAPGHGRRARRRRCA